MAADRHPSAVTTSDREVREHGASGRLEAHQYCWLQNPDFFRDYVSSDRIDVIPVLLPESSTRRTIWETILHWYGLEDARGSDRRGLFMSPPPAAISHPVVTFDADCGPVAEAYAAFWRRPVVHAEDLEDVERLSTHSDSLLLIGRAAHFSARSVQDLGRRIKIPWGVCTGRDLPALSFVLAKLRANQVAVSRRGAIVDAIERTRSVHVTYDLGERAQALDSERLRTFLRQHELDILVVYAHGESGHINLQSAVLCGLADNWEDGPLGEIAGGCRNQNGQRRCKRVSDPQVTIVSFGDLQTRSLCLLTCNGFAVGPELYPSDLSCVLSCSEGYAASVLALDRIVSLEPWLPEALADLTTRGVSLGTIQHLQNDRWARRADCRPYVLFGDPYSPPMQWPIVADDGRVPMSEGRMHVFSLGLWAKPKVVGLEPPNKELHLTRGVHYGTVTGSGEDTTTRLIDRTEAWSEANELLRHLVLRLHRAARIERAVGTLCPGQDTLPRYRPLLKNLSRLREHLEVSVQRGLRELEVVRSVGTWSEQLEDLVTLCKLSASSWDHSFSDMLGCGLLQEEFHQALLDGALLEEQTEDTECDYCGCLLAEHRVRSPFDATPALLWTCCPTCGVREVWERGGVRLETVVPDQLIPGAVVEIDVHLRGKSAAPYAPAGMLVVQLKDNGRQKISFSRCERVEASRVGFSLLVPPNSSSAIHTLRFAWVHDLGITYMRQRRPCVRLRDA